MQEGGETEMWRSKKFIIVAVLVAVILSGTIGGVVLATNGDEIEPEAQHEALLDRVCEIYQEKTGVAIDQVAFKDAFAQAQSEMQTEALENYLQSLIEQDKITQEQADELQEWHEARPDVPAGFGFKGPGGFRGMGRMRGFGWPCVPQNN